MKPPTALRAFPCLAGLLFGLPSLLGQLRPAYWEFDPGLVGGFPEGPSGDDIVPGEFLIDPPTLENLGFRWYVEGDRNRNASVTVAFRRVGENEWREGLPLLRIGHEIVTRYFSPLSRNAPPPVTWVSRHYRTSNLFAGSVMFLEPGTKYEVRFTMTDPDGGAPTAPRIVTAETRAEPVVPRSGRILPVYPRDARLGRGSSGAYASVAAALADARPGEVVLLQPGVYPIPEAPLRLTRSGEPGRPIVLRGSGAGRTILEGPDLQTDLFQVEGADHLLFEDLTLRRVHTAIAGGKTGGPGASWLTVRRCHIEEAINGIWTTSENSQNWYVADNVITGTDRQWHPRPNGTYMAGSHTGVNVYGQGHVVCYNRVSRFSDSLAVANVSAPSSADFRRHPVNIDFYGNDLSFAVDDTIEADFGCHNIRVYRNLVYNAHTALSAQPTFGGPIYFIRNVAYGITSLSFKWNNQAAGPVAYHNTLVSGRNAFNSPLWSNGHLRNNLILGNNALIASGTFTPGYSTLDDNGWRGSGIRWTQTPGGPVAYSSLAEFAAATGFERHGRMVDFDIFVHAAPVQPGTTYARMDFDLRLRSGSRAVDAGVRLPNINDDFAGSAPDLGAFERERPRPHYGPRP